MDDVRSAFRSVFGEEVVNSVPEELDSRVYFLQIGDAGPIKIGVSRTPQARCDELQTGLPWLVQLLGTMAGDKQTESDLHKRFDRLQIRGEWFSAHADLLSFIEANATPFTHGEGILEEKVRRLKAGNPNFVNPVRKRRSIGKQKMDIDKYLEELLRQEIEKGANREQLLADMDKMFDEIMDVKQSASAYVKKCRAYGWDDKEIIEEIWKALAMEK